MQGSASLSPDAMSGGKLLRKRIDQLLVERGEAESRTRAQALVMAGLVFAGPPDKLQKITKSGQQVPDE